MHRATDVTLGSCLSKWRWRTERQLIILARAFSSSMLRNLGATCAVTAFATPGLLMQPQDIHLVIMSAWLSIRNLHNSSLYND